MMHLGSRFYSPALRSSGSTTGGPPGLTTWGYIWSPGTGIIITTTNSSSMQDQMKAEMEFFTNLTHRMFPAPAGGPSEMPPGQRNMPPLPPPQQNTNFVGSMRRLMLSWRLLTLYCDSCRAWRQSAT